VALLPSSTPTPLPCPIHGTAMNGSRRPKVRRLSHPFSKTCKKSARPTHPGIESAPERVRVPHVRRSFV
jgi:hypothetical protein